MKAIFKIFGVLSLLALLVGCPRATPPVTISTPPVTISTHIPVIQQILGTSKSITINPTGIPIGYPGQGGSTVVRYLWGETVAPLVTGWSASVVVTDGEIFNYTNPVLGAITITAHVPGDGSVTYNGFFPNETNGESSIVITISSDGKTFTMNQQIVYSLIGLSLNTISSPNNNNQIYTAYNAYVSSTLSGTMDGLGGYSGTGQSIWAYSYTYSDNTGGITNGTNYEYDNVKVASSQNFFGVETIGLKGTASGLGSSFPTNTYTSFSIANVSSYNFLPNPIAPTPLSETLYYWIGTTYNWINESGNPIIRDSSLPNTSTNGPGGDTSGVTINSIWTEYVPISEQ